MRISLVVKSTSTKNMNRFCIERRASFSSSRSHIPGKLRFKFEIARCRCFLSIVYTASPSIRANFRFRFTGQQCISIEPTRRLTYCSRSIRLLRGLAMRVGILEQSILIDTPAVLPHRAPVSVASLSNIEKDFGERVLFDKINLTIYENERIGLIGANGSGKTTLFKILTGEMTPDSGNASIGRNVRVGYLSQDPAFDPANSVIDEAELAFSALHQLAHQLRDLEHEMAGLEGDAL